MKDTPIDLVEIYVWPDATYCYEEDLEEFLTFLSDDYQKVLCKPGKEAETALKTVMYAPQRRSNDQRKHI